MISDRRARERRKRFAVAEISISLCIALSIVFGQVASWIITAIMVAVSVIMVPD
jgi:hypothetical protein